jgi:hypothetical protein
VLLDVTPHALFTWGVDGTVMPLIERNSTIPTRKSRVFTTVADNQTRIEVDVWQGAQILDSKSLAKFELTNIPPAPKAVPQVEVGFEIDVNGIVSVEATDQATGRRQAMTIHPSGGLSQADVNRLVAETRARDCEDKSKKEHEVLAWPPQARAFEDSLVFSPEERDLLVRLSGLFVKVNRSFGAPGDGLTGEQRQEIEAILDRARTALREGMRDELRASVQGMQRASHLLEKWSGPTRSEVPESPVAGPPLDLEPATNVVPGGTMQPAETPTAQRQEPNPSRGVSAFKQWVSANLRLLRSVGKPVVSGGVSAKRQPDAPATGSHSVAGQTWSAAAVEHYRELVRARLSDGSCVACGASLAAALLVRTDTRVGPELNEFGLSDEGAARYLAATDSLVVKCARCGAESVVPGERTADADQR